MNTASYPSPVDKLLTYGEAEILESYKEWPDYLELGFGPEHIPELIRMATDIELRNDHSDGLKEWAPVHAWRTLGQLRAEAAIEPLLDHFDEFTDDDWASEELPEVFGLIGPAAIPALTDYLADKSHKVFARIDAMSTLETIARMCPETRDECVTALTHQLELFAENEPGINSFLIVGLVHLKVVETLPLIKQAFEAHRVDESVIDLDYVLVKFSLKERKVIESPFSEMFKTPLPATLKQAGKPFSPPKTSYSQRLTRNTSDQVIKFSHKKITKKKSKKKR